jgi:pimeloyl-ACP methyl ester carboxylesterase
LFLIVAQVGPPTRMRVVISPAETVAVSLRDGASPVVLVPGLIGAGFTYRKVAPLLAEQGFRTVIVEPLGVGGSSRPENADYSLGAQADRVAATLDSLGVEGAVLVAHAVGGSIALRLAARRPDLISGLVLIEAGVAESATTPGFRRAMKFAPLLRLFGGVGLIRGKVRDQLARDSGDPSWVDDSVIAGYTADAGSDLGATLRAYRRMADARERDSIAPHLSDIHVPVLLLLGGAPHTGGPRNDEITPPFRKSPEFHGRHDRGHRPFPSQGGIGW